MPGLKDMKGQLITAHSLIMRKKKGEKNEINRITKCSWR